MARTWSIVVPITIVCVVTISMSSLGNVTLATRIESSDSPEKMYKEKKYVISEKRSVSLPEFEWKKAKIPLSVDEAIKIAWQSVDLKDHYYFGRITLSFVDAKQKAVWFYEVEFEPNAAGPTKSVVVLLDGKIVEPTVTEMKDKSSLFQHTKELIRREKGL